MNGIKRRRVLVSFPGIREVKRNGDRLSYVEPNGLEHVFTGPNASHWLYTALGDRGVSVQDRERIFEKLES